MIVPGKSPDMTLSVTMITEDPAAWRSGTPGSPPDRPLSSDFHVDSRGPAHDSSATATRIDLPGGRGSILGPSRDVADCQGIPVPKRFATKLRRKLCHEGRDGAEGSGRSAAGQQAQRAFLLEVERPARRGGDAAEPAAQVRDGGADRRLGQHPQPERQRGGADVIAALEFERGRDGFQVRLAELPVRRPVPPPGQPRAPLPARRLPARYRPAPCLPARVPPSPAPRPAPPSPPRRRPGPAIWSRTCGRSPSSSR